MFLIVFLIVDLPSVQVQKRQLLHLPRYDGVMAYYMTLGFLWSSSG